MDHTFLLFDIQRVFIQYKFLNVHWRKTIESISNTNWKSMAHRASERGKWVKRWDEASECIVNVENSFEKSKERETTLHLKKVSCPLLSDWAFTCFVSRFSFNAFQSSVQSSVPCLWNPLSIFFQSSFNLLLILFQSSFQSSLQCLYNSTLLSIPFHSLSSLSSLSSFSWISLPFSFLSFSLVVPFQHRINVLSLCIGASHWWTWNALLNVEARGRSIESETYSERGDAIRQEMEEHQSQLWNRDFLRVLDVSWMHREAFSEFFSVWRSPTF